MNIFIVPTIMDAESFVAISEHAPDPSQTVDWYWRFQVNETPSKSLFQSKCVWIQIRKQEANFLMEHLKRFPSKERVYVSRGLFKSFSKCLKSQKNIFVFANRETPQEDLSHVWL